MLLIIAIVLFLVVLAGLFAWSYGPTLQRPGSFIAAICALLLFLLAIRVLPI